MVSKVGSGVGSKPDSIRAVGFSPPVQKSSRHDQIGTAIHRRPGVAFKPSQRGQRRGPRICVLLHASTAPRPWNLRHPLTFSSEHARKVGAVPEPGRRPKPQSLNQRVRYEGCCCSHHHYCRHPSVSTHGLSTQASRKLLWLHANDPDATTNIHGGLIHQAVR